MQKLNNYITSKKKESGVHVSKLVQSKSGVVDPSIKSDFTSDFSEPFKK